MFGGSISNNSKRHFKNDLIELNLGIDIFLKDLMEWSTIPPIINNISRINHGFCLFGYYKIVHGGVIFKRFR